MKNSLFFPLVLISACFFFGCQGTNNAQSSKGTLSQLPDFESKYIGSRNIEIYLPPGYEQNSNERYPVLYMHDGQNLFNGATGYSGQEWRMDENLDSLIALGQIEPCIVVGPWNATVARFTEYMPQAPVQNLPDSVKAGLDNQLLAALSADRYLKFLVEELKPYIDTNYRTKADPPNTFLAGSSMGGLISMYTIANYPAIFGGAACLSTHWPISLDNSTPAVAHAVIDFFGENLPDPSNHQLYFDFGTEGLDAFYEPYQQRMDVRLREKGYTKGKNWLSQKFPGDGHNERSWANRMALPLTFLLGK
ncbi:MAG: alpha/beta hydrolase-fold protein [Bacteroidota bacterium]